MATPKRRFLCAGTVHVVAGFFTKGVTGTVAAQTANILPLIGGEYTLRQSDFRFRNSKARMPCGSSLRWPQPRDARSGPGSVRHQHGRGYPRRP